MADMMEENIKEGEDKEDGERASGKIKLTTKQGAPETAPGRSMSRCVLPTRDLLPPTSCFQHYGQEVRTWAKVEPSKAMSRLRSVTPAMKQ